MEAWPLTFDLQGPSAEELFRACLGPTATGEVSAAKFNAALQEVKHQNALVDLDFVARCVSEKKQHLSSRI